MGDLLRAPKTFQSFDNIPVHKSARPQRFSGLAALFFADSIKDLGPPMVVPIAVIRFVLWMSASTIPLNLSADRRGTSA